MNPAVPGQSPVPENFVLKISKPGFDVRSATPDQLAFNSSQPTLQVALAIQVTGGNSGGAGPIAQTYEHGLGYAPGYLAFATGTGTGFSGTRNYFVNLPSGTGGVPVYVEFVDINTFGVVYTDNTTAYTTTVTIYLLQTPAQLIAGQAI